MTSPRPRVLGIALSSLIVSMPAWAVYGKEDPRLERLYERFMSPCCWQQNLTLHDSPVANELRASIQAMVQNGRSDEEIKEALVATYGKRILALPEGPARHWLFATPWTISGVALIGLAAYLRRLLRPNAEFSPNVAPAAPEDGWEEI